MSTGNEGSEKLFKRQTRKLYVKYNFIELARFIAHVQADGSFMPKTNSFRYYNQDLDLMNEFVGLSHSLFGVKTWKFYKKSNGCYETGFSNKSIAIELKEFSFRSSNWLAPDFVKNGSENVKANYLQVFF